MSLRGWRGWWYGDPGHPQVDWGCRLERGGRFAPRKHHVCLFCVVLVGGVVWDLHLEIIFTEYWVDTAPLLLGSRTGEFALRN